MRSCDDGYPSCRKAEADGKWCERECEACLDTPETNAAARRSTPMHGLPKVSAAFAGKLERERDEWKRKLLALLEGLECNSIDRLMEEGSENNFAHLGMMIQQRFREKISSANRVLSDTPGVAYRGDAEDGGTDAQ